MVSSFYKNNSDKIELGLIILAILSVIAYLTYLLGVFQKSIITAAIASLGVIFAAAYMLWLYKRVIFGKIKNQEVTKMLDLNKHEILILWSLAVPIIFFGFYPEPLINTMEVSINNLIDMYNSNLSNNIVMSK